MNADIFHCEEKPLNDTPERTHSLKWVGQFLSLKDLMYPMRHCGKYGQPVFPNQAIYPIILRNHITKARHYASHYLVKLHINGNSTSTKKASG